MPYPAGDAMNRECMSHVMHTRLVSSSVISFNAGLTASSQKRRTQRIDVKTFSVLVCKEKASGWH
jgi:hypothetical protein